MRRLGLEREMVDQAVYERTVERFRRADVVMPTFAQLARPERIPPSIRARLVDVDPDTAHPLNLFRAHWYNGRGQREPVAVPEHVVLPPELTGVEATIVVALGDRFPMIHSHKVIAAYGCLAPRIVTGQFDPTRQRAVWPSTGNYCRGGVAISRILGARGVAVLPEGMSRERFAWLERWVTDPADIIRTPGTESNVKEIYDRCAELDREPDTVIFNQFSEFGNHIAHYALTGRALEHVVEHLQVADPDLRLRAFVSATGSAGTIAAGDYLKERHGSLTVAVEALECPTLLANGFGEHNIQGIGDKHVPLIHNVMATDIVAAVSRSGDGCVAGALQHAGRPRPARPPRRPSARHRRSRVLRPVLDLQRRWRPSRPPGSSTSVPATSSSRWPPTVPRCTPPRSSASSPATTPTASTRRTRRPSQAEHLEGVTTDHMLECTRADRDRIFNLGYFTWVEQQGIPLDEFEARRSPAFWTGLRAMADVWDELIDAFNAEVGAVVAA